jgi:hypothetical protein
MSQFMPLNALRLYMSLDDHERRRPLPARAASLLPCCCGGMGVSRLRCGGAKVT